MSYTLHIQDMFYVGRENLTGKEQFWNDWIALLQTKSGEVASRLLKEAVFERGGIEGLLKVADKNANIHPSLYLTVMDEYAKKHDYVQMEKVGEQAVGKIDKNFTKFNDNFHKLKVFLYVISLCLILYIIFT